MKETILNNQEFDGIGISTMDNLIEKSIAHAEANSNKEIERKQFENNIARVVKEHSSKSDRAYKLLFSAPSDTFLESYEKHIKQTKDIMEKIKSGKGKEMIKNELDKLDNVLLNDKKALESILKLDKKRVNVFNGDMSKLRALLDE